MSLQYTERVVALLRRDLASEGELDFGEKLDELEERYLQLSAEFDVDRDDALKSLLVTVAKEGALLGNADLSLYALNKLDPNNPISLLNLNSKSPSEKAELITNYLQISSRGQSQEIVRTGEQLKHLVDVGDKQHTDGEPLDIQSRSRAEQEKNLEKARNDEIEENFREALISFEQCGAHDYNFLRVSIKHLMCASNEFLHNYCRNKHELRLIWLEYILALGEIDKAISFCENIGEESLSSSLRLTKHATKPNDLAEFLHADIREFALVDDSKWSNTKKLDGLVSLSDSLRSHRSLLAELISHHLMHGNMQLAMSVAVSLNGAHLVSDQFLAQCPNLSINLNRTSSESSLYEGTLHLLHHLSSVMCHDTQPNSEIILSACIDLGLVDNFLQLIESTRNLNEFELGRMIKTVERATEFVSQEAFDTIDPTLREPTAESVMNLARQDNRRDVNIQLITVIILTIDVFLMKLETGQQSAGLDRSILELEKMFSHLADNLDGLTLSASDGLIKSTNSLVIAIKSRLDALADSEIIRTSFIKIVDTVAGLCLIDARYKSAAILYSQIEDNVSATKALMRTGEAETVMNYALLVRDITVNRITINYIKHLKLEPEAIENFIKQCKL